MSNPEKNSTMLAAIAALTLAAGIAGAAYAADSDSDSHELVADESLSSEFAGDSIGLPVEDILAKLRTAGYTEFRQIEGERGRYEVKGRDAHGQRVELYVDARTGDVLKEERDD